MVKTVIIIVLQLIISVISVIVTYIMGIGNGWEIAAFALWATLIAIIGGRFVGGQSSMIGAIIGAIIGAALLFIPSVAFGFQGAFLPYIGALLGYYIPGLMRRA